MSPPTLEQQLKTLHLTAIADNYQALAQEAAADNWSYETYLTRLFTLETERRTRNRRIRRIKEAKFPLQKELADFDFAAIPQLKKQQIVTLAKGAYLPTAAPI